MTTGDDRSVQDSGTEPAGIDLLKVTPTGIRSFGEASRFTISASHAIDVTFRESIWKRFHCFHSVRDQ